MMQSKCKIALVHKGIWDMEKLSMPLACGYIKSCPMGQQDIKNNVEIQLYNYGDGDGILDILPELLMENHPDIVDGFDYYQRTDVQFNFNFRQIINNLQNKRQMDRIHEEAKSQAFYYRVGFENYIDNHEVVLRYAGRAGLELEIEIANRKMEESKQEHFHVVGMPERINRN